MSKISTIADLLSINEPSAPAISAPGKEPMTYGQLDILSKNTISKLNTLGISRNDRVAIVVPNGPEMAAIFISVARGATAAPLNPNYTTDEYEFYLSDINAAALIVESKKNCPSAVAAKNLGIKVIELIPEKSSVAGEFILLGKKSTPITKENWVLESDIALILHTSGTTSKPKIVPLSQKNIISSSKNIASWLSLKPNDKCLNIMPLFHIHGLIGAVLASLYSGSCVTCTKGFNVLSFFSWLEKEKPSWYTAVPTMHQAILTRANRNQAIVKNSSLRFIRSSSASLPLNVLKQLEQTFEIPVIESYGMTEASHQMTSNPLPPRKRLPGSVGIAAGPKVAIMDQCGTILGPDQLGEVVIKGNNVILGYENNKDSNKTSFTKGWFRTGDQGYLNSDGYLNLTGRLKEIINRGGEKISPLEVDERLQQHPSVHQAVTFSIPHDKLGEDVAAAVVLAANKKLLESELKIFAAEKLSNFKVPKTILFVEEIPKGATGKLQRIGLAKKLGLA